MRILRKLLDLWNQLKYDTMRNISFIIFFITLSTTLIAQSNEYEFRVTDLNNEYIYFHSLIIDDSIYVMTEINDILSDEQQIYKANLSEGKHKISASIEGYKMIDTIITFSPGIKNIDLSVDMKNDFHLYEFQNGFDKIYTNKDYLPIIGLRKDGTFLLRSFFHVSIVGCFQYERGKYKIENNILILDIDSYKSECFNSPQEIRHRYEYTIDNDSIIDIKKYYGFIEKKYIGVNY